MGLGINRKKKLVADSLMRAFSMESLKGLRELHWRRSKIDACFVGVIVTWKKNELKVRVKYDGVIVKRDRVLLQCNVDGECHRCEASLRRRNISSVSSEQPKMLKYWTFNWDRSDRQFAVVDDLSAADLHRFECQLEQQPHNNCVTRCQSTDINFSLLCRENSNLRCFLHEIFPFSILHFFFVYFSSFYIS